MIARIWRGWAATACADEVAAHLRDVPLARYASAPGNISAELLLRPLAGGVELMTFSLWESADAVPTGVEEDHRLLVARQTIPDCWEMSAGTAAIARAA
jgi:heme-degrading monooxygenase HmoA